MGSPVFQDPHFGMTFLSQLEGFTHPTISPTETQVITVKIPQTFFIFSSSFPFAPPENNREKSEPEKTTFLTFNLCFRLPGYTYTNTHTHTLSTALSIHLFCCWTAGHQRLSWP